MAKKIKKQISTRTVLTEKAPFFILVKYREPPYSHYPDLYFPEPFLVKNCDSLEEMLKGFEKIKNIFIEIKKKKLTKPQDYFIVFEGEHKGKLVPKTMCKRLC